MKKKLLAAFLALLLFPAFGEAGLLVTQDQEQIFPGGTNRFTMVLKFKGKKLRVDLNIPEVPMSTVNDFSTGGGFTLLHKTKTYTEATPSAAKESLEVTVEHLKELHRIPSTRPRLKATGATKTINNWKCSEYIAETQALKATYCIAPELAWAQPEAEAIVTPRYAELNKQFPDLSLVRGFPVLTVLEQTAPNGAKITTTMRVLSIERREIPDSDFVIPREYKSSQQPVANGHKP